MDFPSFVNPQEIEDLRDDIQMHTVLLHSLDDNESDAEESRKSIKRTLKRLKKRLRQLQPESEPSTMPVKQERVTAVKREPIAMMDGSNDTGRFLASPTFDLVSRKRQREDLDGDEPQPKSRRHSPSPNSNSLGRPSPAPSGASGSEASFDFDDPILQSLIGGYSREDDAKEKEFLAEIVRRKQQEQEDEDLARRLQAEIDEEAAAAVAPSSQKSSAFPPSSTQSFFRADGTINRTLPRLPDMPANPKYPTFNNPSGKPEVSPPAYNRFPPVYRHPATPARLDQDDDVEQTSRNDFPSQYTGSVLLTNPYPQPSRYGQNMPGAFPGLVQYGSVPGTSVYGGAHVYGAPIHNGPATVPSRGGGTGVRGLMNDAVSSMFDAMGLPGSSSNPFDLESFNNFRDNFANSAETEEHIKNLLKQIRPDEELSEEERSHMPDGLKIPLMKHQAAGVAWMKRMEESTNKGGILADDMGLGKTLQTIALLLARPPPAEKRLPTLIVAPLALLRQWKEEIEKFVRPSHRMNVLILHGPNKPSQWVAIKAYDVIITTYSTLASELKRKVVFEEKRKMIPDAVPQGKEECPILGPRSIFHRVVLDEAQNVKNRNTKGSLAACQINASYRWCLTGTPMQNNVDEMYSLIKFCRIRPFNDYEKFRSEIGGPLRNFNVRESIKQKAMEKLQALLKGCMLRRNKKSEIDGQPILQLPAKHAVEDRAHFDSEQLNFYRALESQAQIQFNKYIRAGTIGRNYSHALVLLLRLRQACCHPHLITNSADFVSAIGDFDMLGADFDKNAKALKPDVVERIKQSTNELECPVCMDVSENPVIFTCGHAICNDCLSRLTENAFTNEGENSKATCPHCRAVIDAQKVTNLVSFLKIYCPEDERVQKLPEEERSRHVDTDSDDSSDEDSDSNDGADLRDFIVDDEEDVEYDTDASSRRKKSHIKKHVKGSTSDSRSSSKARSKCKGKGKGRDEQKKSLKGKSLAELRKEGLKSKSAKKKYLKKLAKDYQPSAKIEKTISLLEEIRDHNKGEKTIVFSSFTSFLDLIEVPLAAHPDLNVYTRYDGSMKRQDREDAVYRFKEDRRCKVMLVSLKAGNAGLNLTAANHVIILDPFWNPFVEYQAADRCYRIGQMREVTIHRILIGEEGRNYAAIADGDSEDLGENNFTVEDRILKLQEKKRKLVEMALDETAGERIGRLGARELGYLFGVNSLN